MLVLPGLFLPLALLKPELPIVHQLADRGFGLGRDLDQVQILLLGDAQGLCGRHNAKLLTRGANQPDLLVADILIQFMHLLTNGQSTSILKITKRGHRKASARQRTAGNGSSGKSFLTSSQVRWR